MPPPELPPEGRTGPLDEMGSAFGDHAVRIRKQETMKVLQRRFDGAALRIRMVGCTAGRTRPEESPPFEVLRACVFIAEAGEVFKLSTALPGWK